MITSTSRGWEIVFESNQWIWADTKESITKERGCKKCGELPTKEGHDACLGYIKGAKYACCGHGLISKSIIY